MPKIKMPRKSFKIDFCGAWLCVELQKKQSVEPFSVRSRRWFEIKPVGI